MLPHGVDTLLKEFRKDQINELSEDGGVGTDIKFRHKANDISL